MERLLKNETRVVNHVTWWYDVNSLCAERSKSVRSIEICFSNFRANLSPR